MSTLEDRSSEVAKADFATVEVARCEDVVQILETLRLALKSAGTPYPEPDLPYALQAMLDLIAQGLVAVAWAPLKSRVAGCLVLDFGRWPWVHPNNLAGQHLYNQHFWIEPRYRAGGIARDFLKFAKAVADEKQLPLVFEISNMSDSAELRDRFVRISGLTYTGGKFYRAPQAKI